MLEGAFCLRQNVDIVVKPVPRIVSTWLIGVGKVLSTLIRLKACTSLLLCDSPCTHLPSFTCLLFLPVLSSSPVSCFLKLYKVLRTLISLVRSLTLVRSLSHLPDVMLMKR